MLMLSNVVSGLTVGSLMFAGVAGRRAELGGHGDRTQQLQQRDAVPRQAAGPSLPATEPHVSLPDGEYLGLSVCPDASQQ